MLIWLSLPLLENLIETTCDYMVFHLRYVFQPKYGLGKSHNLLWINAFKAQGVDSE